MDAMPFDTSCEEEQLWTAAIEADQQIGREWLRRAELIARAHAVGAAAGRSEFVVCEVAAACCVDERTADVLLHEALELLGLPALVDAVDAGLLRLPHARVVLEEVRACEPPLAALVVADVLTRVSDQAPAAVRQIVRRAINRADPAAAEARRRTAAANRSLRLIPGRDGMADLLLHLKAETAMRIYGVAMAATAQDDGSGRTADARRSDWIVAQILGRGTGPVEATAVGSRVRGCQVIVTMSASTALGLDDEPCELDGYGPITAQHGRELLDGAELRRAVLDVLSGQLVDLDEQARRPAEGGHTAAIQAMLSEPVPLPADPEDGYRPSAHLARTVRARSTSCDFPSCSVRSARCDLDHTRPHPQGATEAGNLGPRSRRHHRAKQAGWRPSATWDGGTSWQAPSGKTYRKPPSREVPRGQDGDPPADL